MKTKHYKRIEKFMQLAGQDTPKRPVEPSEEIRVLRAKLIIEEALETVKALGVDITLAKMSFLENEDDFEYGISEHPFDMIEVADGVADISVVSIGTLIACGITDEKLLKLVDKNNLAKFGEGHSFREDGKLIKPPGHKPPDIRKLLNKMGWKG